MSGRSPRIQALRRRSERAMPSTVSVAGEEEIVGYDPGGYPIYAPGQSIETSGRLEGLSADEVEVAGRYSEQITGKLTVPVDTPLEANQVVEVDGESWNVSGILPGSPGHMPHLEVFVARSA